MPDVAEAYLGGVRTAQARAAQQQEAALRSSELEQSAARAGQEQAFRQQQLRMRQQQLEAAAQQSARKYTAQKQYQAFLASGGDPLQAVLKFGPAMGEGSSVAAATRASAMMHPKPVVPPSIQMQPGPNGTQIPILVHGNKASVIPQSAFAPKPPPEQWQDATRKINGQDVPGQLSSRTGRFVPYPAAEQAGSVTPQTRLQIAALQKKKAAIQKLLDDPMERAIHDIALKNSGGKSGGRADMNKAREQIQAQADAIDSQIDQLTGGTLSRKPSEQPEDQASDTTMQLPKEGDVVKGYKFKGGDPSDKANWEKE